LQSRRVSTILPFSWRTSDPPYVLRIQLGLHVVHTWCLTKSAKHVYILTLECPVMLCCKLQEVL
jgi:hypothetical protein